MPTIKRRADIDIEHGNNRITINIELKSENMFAIFNEIYAAINCHIKKNYKLTSIYFYEENIK